MNVDILTVPYDSGLRSWRMGAGPERLLKAGLVEHLRSAGHGVRIERIETASEPAAEIRTAFELNRILAERVSAAAQQDRLPLVLAGNCITAVGALAGIANSEPAVLWLDAHGDLNTPETTRSGFLDGMALAILTGSCWRSLAETVLGFQPVEERRVVHVGAHELDDAERELLARSEIAVITPDRVGSGVVSALQGLRSLTTDLYVHVDLDVLDPSEGRANTYAAPDGLRVAETASVMREAAERFRIRAITLSAYDPEADEEGRIPAAAFALLDALLRSDS